MEPFAQAARPARELYDLLRDPTETNNVLLGHGAQHAEGIANKFAERLHDGRVKTGDVIPLESAGARISNRSTVYVSVQVITPTSRPAVAADSAIPRRRVGRDEHGDLAPRRHW